LILRSLRKPEENSGYKIPRGGFYSVVSCPNYFGEIMEWIGWAILTWSLAGLTFAFWTTANLLPRAISHHKWYKEQFEDYPEKRKALIPFLL
jgi:protein-S-isoprenylcysteine O-methyltransferase Ste14